MNKMKTLLLATAIISTVSFAEASSDPALPILFGLSAGKVRSMEGKANEGVYDSVFQTYANETTSKSCRLMDVDSKPAYFTLKKTLLELVFKEAQTAESCTKALDLAVLICGGGTLPASDSQDAASFRNLKSALSNKTGPGVQDLADSLSKYSSPASTTRNLLKLMEAGKFGDMAAQSLRDARTVVEMVLGAFDYQEFMSKLSLKDAQFSGAEKGAVFFTKAIELTSFQRVLEEATTLVSPNSWITQIFPARVALATKKQKSSTPKEQVKGPSLLAKELNDIFIVGPANLEQHLSLLVDEKTPPAQRYFNLENFKKNYQDMVEAAMIVAKLHAARPATESGEAVVLNPNEELGKVMKAATKAFEANPSISQTELLKVVTDFIA